MRLTTSCLLIASALLALIAGCYRSHELATDGVQDAGDTVRDAGHTARDAGEDARVALPDAGQDSGPPPSCTPGPGLDPYDGDLPCVDGPCTVIASEVLPHMGCGSERPRIAFAPDGEPEVLYETRWSGTSWLARRHGGAFTATPVPTFARGAIALDRAGCGYAWITSDRDELTGLYLVEGGSFALVRAAETPAWATSMALDRTGALHLIGLFANTVGAIDATASWTVIPAPSTNDSIRAADLAIGPDGTPHRLWEDDLRPGVVFYEHAGEVTPVLPTTLRVPGLVSEPRAALALAGTTGPGRPRVLATDDETLFMAWRDADAGPFTSVLVDLGAEAIGLAASADGDAVGVARRPTFGGLMIVGFHAGEVSTQDLGVDISAGPSSAALGPNGHLHIAVCGDDEQVHYLEVASAP